MTDDFNPTLFFGLKWDVPLLDSATQFETPVGEACLHCKEPIEIQQQGLLRNYVSGKDEAGNWMGGLAPLHRECDLRMTLGSIGHLERRCSCYGGTEDDPPGMTTREAARAVYEWSVRHGGAR